VAAECWRVHCLTIKGHAKPGLQHAGAPCTCLKLTCTVDHLSKHLWCNASLPQWVEEAATQSPPTQFTPPLLHNSLAGCRLPALPVLTIYSTPPPPPGPLPSCRKLCIPLPSLLSSIPPPLKRPLPVKHPPPPHLRYSRVAVVQAVSPGAEPAAHVVVVEGHTHIELTKGGDAVPDQSHTGAAQRQQITEAAAEQRRLKKPRESQSCAFLWCEACCTCSTMALSLVGPTRLYTCRAVGCLTY